MLKKILIGLVVAAAAIVFLSGKNSRKKELYFGEDVCSQITKQTVERVIKRPIVRADSLKLNGLYNCTYYLDENNYVMLVLDYANVEKQMSAQIAKQRVVETNNRIGMRNAIIWQNDGMLNSIYLIFNDNKFITIERTAWSGLFSDDLIRLASGLAEEIKGYK